MFSEFWTRVGYSGASVKFTAESVSEQYSSAESRVQSMGCKQAFGAARVAYLGVIVYFAAAC